MAIISIGIILAKNVFALWGVDALMMSTSDMQNAIIFIAFCARIHWA